MSEYVHYTGTLKPIHMLDSVEETCEVVLKHHGIEMEQGYGSFKEMFFDQFYTEYTIIGEQIYKVERETIANKNIIFHMHKKPDGTLSFEVKYYNGACSFDEALEESFDRMNYENN